jgi:hypothetical protein
MVCVTRILRTLVHDVGTTSSVAIGQIPICLPTQFSCHKNGSSQIETWDISIQIPKDNFVPLYICLSHQERIRKGRNGLIEKEMDTYWKSD